MIVSELIEKLQNYPPNMEVCISDEGMGEGGTPRFTLVEELACNARLDGDECCGLLYTWEDDPSDVPEGMLHVENDLYSFKVLMLIAE